MRLENLQHISNLRHLTQTIRGRTYLL